MLHSPALVRQPSRKAIKVIAITRKVVVVIVFSLSLWNSAVPDYESCSSGEFLKSKVLVNCDLLTLDSPITP